MSRFATVLARVDVRRARVGRCWSCDLEDSELIVTPPRVMIQPFRFMSGLHQRVSIVLGVCEGCDRVEAVSESVWR